MLLGYKSGMSIDLLPYDAEVEYLGSTEGGGQYINTGYIPKSNSGVQLSFRLGYVATNDAVFGSRTSGADDRFWIVPSSAGLNCGFGSSYTLPAPSTNTNYTAQLNFSASGAASYGSNSVNVSGFGGCPFPLYLFAANVSGTASFMSYGKRIYGCKITEDSEVVADFIPVRKGTVGYLYDRVSHKLFGNAGTGDFVLGPDVVPVEYIESGSNHIQVIDTGFYANQNTKSLITFEKLGADGWLFGSRNGSSSATDKFGIFAYRSPDGKISAQVGNIYIEPIISGGLTNRKKTIELSLADGVTVDGETIATFSESQKSQTFTSTYPMALFNMRISSSGHNSGIYCRVYAYQIFENGLIARNFRPVRVGTGSTWEGAMMDVLTRRVYRNAGAGAFGYGNDLKCPIPAK